MVETLQFTRKTDVEVDFGADCEPEYWHFKRWEKWDVENNFSDYGGELDKVEEDDENFYVWYDDGGIATVPKASAKIPKPKKGFLDGYKTYDASEGYGHPEQWKEAFFERLGVDKALEVLGEDDPLQLLGITTEGFTWDDILKAYRKMMMKWHPDRNPGNKDAHEMSKKLKF
jgi:DnaJ-domain-containing protein 1